LNSFGIGPRLIIVTVGVGLMLALCLATLAADRLEDKLRAGFIDQGEMLATSLSLAAERSGAQGAALNGLLREVRKQRNLDYLLFVDTQGRLRGHSFDQEPPAALLEANRVVEGELSPLSQPSRARPVEVASEALKLESLDVAVLVTGGLEGVVHVGIPQSDMQRPVSSLWVEMLGVALGLLLLGGGAAALLARSVVRPLRELNQVAAQIVESGDLNRPVSVSSSDEVGQLARSFAQMVARLREVTLQLQQAVSALSQATQGLSSSSTEQSQTITRQAVALQETQVTAQEIKQTSMLAAQKAAAVLAVVERAEGLSRAGEAAVEQTMTSLNEIRAQVDEIAHKILELGERTTQIGSITETVKDLADQSNMLALNAAIESVRSGENGRGFSVVAREIRALADQSIEATNRVRELLEDISKSTVEAVRSTESGSKRVEAGLEQVRAYGQNLRELSAIVQDNATAVRQIAAAVNQQNVGINQITGAVAELSKMMDETVSRISSTAESISTLQGIAEQLGSAAKTYRVG
jgi:methyl-accepting chemotaxis protein